MSETTTPDVQEPISISGTGYTTGGHHVQVRIVLTPEHCRRIVELARDPE